jgi:16S rRNA (adenine1518-N6/adenine1519-N6)-dimethyltransferase
MPAPPLRKRLGQHHLVDGRLCRPLVEFLEPAGRRVVEIGPGGGVLTAELLAAGAKVLAFELDLAWACELRRRLGPVTGERRLALAVADALTLSWERLAPATLVAGNLPFDAATAILEGLLPHHRGIPRAAFLVQREVAERLVARPGTRAYGALSVLVQARAEVRILGRVKPGSFRPPPKVEGSFVGLALKPPPLPEAEMPGFERLVHLAFGQRRKTLQNALAAAWGRLAAERARAAAGLPPSARAEELFLEAFLRLYAVRPSRCVELTPPPGASAGSCRPR